MKKLIFGITACIVISLVFISCPNDPAGSSGNGDPVIPNNPAQKTVVVFDNTYGICTALVYDDYRRRDDMDKIVEIPAGQCSDEIEQRPSVSTPFYFAYRITLKGVSDFTVDFVPEVGKDQKAVRIDANTRTVIPIPVLDEAVSSEQQVLSPKSYLSIANNSNYSFQLHRGVSMIRPDNFPDSGVVNSGERAPYTINTGRSSDFRLLVGAEFKPFPASPERFEAGNFYRYQYNNDVSLETQIPINLDNVDIKTYTVKFNNNGGSGSVPSTQTVRLASVITLPLGNGLSKGDEIFGGWCADASGSGAVYSAGTLYTVTGDITLYAKWYPANTTLYTVTFDSAGGSETASQRMISDAVVIRPPDPIKAGHTFTGWYRDTVPYDFTTPVTEDFTLYARWIAHRYTVTFNANGADGTAPSAVTVDYGYSITLPGAGGLSKPDETFRSWNTEDDGTGTGYAAGAQYTVTADVTLFAVWNNVPEYEMVFVPDGSFEMGRNLGTGGSDVTPVHTVTLGGYYMGIYEVTQAQYEAVMLTTIEEQQALAGTNTNNYGRGNNYPMYYVSWYDALVFCNKLSMAEGLSPAYMINNSTDPAIWGNIPSSNNAAWDAVEIVSGSTGYRLPTEAQWEYAAKGGNDSGNYTYAGSNNLDDVAWYSGNSASATHSIGTKAPNGLGIYDMSGNVSEWCWDWNGSYSSTAQTDPDGASSGFDRIVRGGSWYYPDQNSSSVFRHNNYQYLRNNSLGFRPVRPASYSITFNINGGTGTAPAAQTSSLGTITLPNGSGFSKAGYIFDGWNTNADGTGTNYSAGSSYTVIGNATLYAKWVYPIITFNINGGSGTTPAAQTASSGSTITLPGGDGFSRSGYAFDGWNTNPSGTGANYNAGSSYMVTGNATLYAKWDGAVVFDLNGGTGATPAAQPASLGSTITLPVGGGFSKSGYIFGGWNTNADGTGTNYNAGSSYTVTVNITLYAKWVPVPEMVFVPGGSFQMGSNNSLDNDASPPHPVTMTGFYMCKYEVTQAQYEAVMRRTIVEQQALAGTGSVNYNYGRGNNYPMYYVSWYEALVFCNKLSIAEDLTPVYRISNSTNPDDWGTIPSSGNNATWDAVTIDSNANGYRLPTEAQWEYAAKGGDTLAAGWVNYTYAGSDTAGDVAWYSDNYYTTRAVGTKDPNGLGLYDMSGNVWEWCWDWYGSYSSGAQTNPTGASSGSSRVIRGGSYVNSVASCRSAFRNNSNPDSHAAIGFRLARQDGLGPNVTFDINGGTGTTPTAQASSSSTIILPGGNGFFRSGYTFGGWNTNAGGTGNNYSAGSSYTVTGNVTLYAKWIEVVVSTTFVVTNTGEWNTALNTIRNGGNNHTYIINVSSNVGITGSTNNTFDIVTGLSVILQGNGKLYLTSQGRIITLAANQTLIIDSAGLTLQGLKNGQNGATQENNNPAVYVDGNTAQLELRNGTISGNSSSSYSGGVYVGNNGTFTMNGGEISGNTASSSWGGGVGVNGTFIMNGGEISGNASSYMGVSVHNNGTFTMNGGEISGNSGGGVFLHESGTTFTMNGGEISGNSGGGVYVNYGTFTMRGGTISGNTASWGGGVRVDRGTFRIVTGTVYGSNASPINLRNTASIGGAALSKVDGTIAQRGIFRGETWVLYGYLSTTDDTIWVVNGFLY